MPEVIEAAQLAFLAALTTAVQARSYVLKGGANLRFFEQSPRSSEDMDFDALDIPSWKLAEGVNSALRAPVVGLLLRTKGIEVVGVSSKKQTETMQRWSLQVNAQGHTYPISVKGEFSHRLSARGLAEKARTSIVAEPVDASIVARYGVPPIVLPRYRPRAAIHQKVVALARRAANQPRDVFDLDLLLTRHRTDAPAKGEVDYADAALAAERATELDYPAFRDAVVPFLDVPVRGFYDTPAAWDAAQQRVVTYLLGLNNA